ncbi:malic enzyme NAD binding domain protein [Clostridium sp. CAG:448]|nr:malic enzyme NAD binding domain protein [Clostridium sp. CAG:448]
MDESHNSNQTKTDIAAESLKKHYEWQGKIEVVSRVAIRTREDLSLAYTPGVAQPCLAIREDPDKSYALTRRANLVAVITDGSAILGLGNIGPEAGMPVMEGKCALFKQFADVDAFPLCIRTQDVDELVRTIYLLSGSFGGINLEDIAAPRCFEVERRLKQICDIPVFHDDQHGTAVVVAAALLNALRVVEKDIGQVRVVINGAGSAGCAIGLHLLHMGVRHLIMVDRCGILAADDPDLHEAHAQIARLTNEQRLHGSLADAMRGADVLIGVSAPGVVTEAMVRSMNRDAIVFPMANPTPEIMPDAAIRAGARIVGTGRSDYPNQINNVLAFPGIFRGALDCRAREINEEMKVAASYALASLIPVGELNENNIIIPALDPRVAKTVAAAVRRAAYRTGVARVRFAEDGEDRKEKTEDENRN